jgi:2-keto-4-pentenoate hydratase/2-oxohepta-3-ene-1,7-dioic acid hydratase in catechol pathway
LPADWPALFARGFFETASLAKILPTAEDARGWTAIALEWDGNAPPGTLTPFPARAVGKILALGKNFREHASEFGEEVPEEPLFFAKLPETLRAHREEVRVPAWYGERVDHEAELAVVIGRGGYAIRAADAMAHVAGYTVANDLTARSLQGADRAKKYPWTRGKNLEGFCPLGPCFVPRDSLDADDLRVRAVLRGETRQDASTRDLVVRVPEAIEYLSRHIALHPLDLVLMGTPAGVGPLEDGDEIVCSVSGIGELATTLRRPHE